MICILNSLPLENLDMENKVSAFLLQFMARKHTVSLYNIVDLDLTFVLSVNMLGNLNVLFKEKLKLVKNVFIYRC